ncbi:hypothetical protein DsansV1_C30g0213961 [Dioscorea sansibarensis]
MITCNFCSFCCGPCKREVVISCTASSASCALCARLCFVLIF